MARNIKDITKTVQQGAWPTCSRSSKPRKDENKPSKATIGKLFVRFQAAFGHKWVSIVPDETTFAAAVAEWQDQLAGISEHEIAQGYRAMNQRPADKRDWPPGAIEFRALCRPHREPYERAEFQGNALPQKTASLETGRHYLRQIRAGFPDGAADCPPANQ